MKKTLVNIFLFLSLSAVSQSVFNRVRADLSPGKNILQILDSCITNSFYKDSALFYEGLIAVKQHSLTEAKNHAKALAKNFPEFHEVHYLNGMIYLAGKNYGKSTTEFTTLLQKNSKHLKALYNRALAFGLMEEYDKAIEDLNSCIALKPMYSLAYYSRGYWHEFLGNYPAAIKDYENTINLDPKNYDAYFGLAYIYQGLKTYDKSCEMINRAIVAGSHIAEDLKDNFCK
jgi:tetratricopeptide (TPR) repeat protein